jgi:hypothetical protein
MMGKLTGLARALAIILAVVGAFVAVPQAALALAVLGIIAGISYDEDARAGLILTTLVLAVIPEAMSHIPNIGGHLGTIAGNLATAAAAAAASSIAIGLFHTAKDDLMGLGK